MNFLDKAVEIISPEKAVKRVKAREILKIYNTGYSDHGASKTKKSLLGWNFKGGFGQGYLALYQSHFLVSNLLLV